MRDTRTLIVVAAATVVLVSCSGSASDTSVVAGSSTTTLPPTTTTTTTTTTTIPSLVIEELPESVEAMGIVSASGAFVDPDGSDAAGTGIATVVDPSGLAITTARAVVGAESITVRLAGVGDPITASLIAHDECANLAVIDLDGDGYHHLELDAQVSPGTTVYGLHLDETGAFSLREGIVESVAGIGTTGWASIEALIEHTAPPAGTSGGPIVDADARVVGISHLPSAGGPERAIPSALAEQLLASRSTVGLGVNAVSVTGPYESGTWVSALTPDSSLAAIGVAPGDVILSIGDIQMAPDGGHGAYCSALSVAREGAVRVEVLRSGPPRRFVGTTGSGAEIQPDFQLARALSYLLPGTSEPAYTYQRITSDDGGLTMEVPVAYTDVTLDGNWGNDDEPRWGPYILATTDKETYLDAWGAPGIWLSTSDTLTADLDRFEWLAARTWSMCTKYGDYAFASGAFEGRYSIWHACSDQGSTIVEVEAYAGDAQYLTLLQAELVDQRDIPALIQAMDTFDVLTAP